MERPSRRTGERSSRCAPSPWTLPRATSRPSLVDVARAASVVAVLGLLLALAYVLQLPGYRPSRLYFSVLVGAIGVLGAVGAVLERPKLVGGSSVGIVLLGFWQFVLGVVMLPVAAVLCPAALLVDDAAGNREQEP